MSSAVLGEECGRHLKQYKQESLIIYKLAWDA